MNSGYGTKERVVGVVRIYGKQNQHLVSPHTIVFFLFRKFNQIGKGLIWKAVTTANGWGCDQFLATVQIQNVRFFRRLKWNSIKQIEIKGIKHHLMEADLNYYKPSKLSRPGSFSEKVTTKMLDKLIKKLQTHSGIESKRYSKCCKNFLT